MKANIGFDGGNDSQKLIVNGKKFKVPTIMYKATEPRKILGGKDKGEKHEYIDVEVNLMNGKIKGNYYIGELASRSGAKESLGGHKADSDDMLIISLSTMAYALISEYPEEREFKINLGTCLPVNEFFLKNASGQYDFGQVLKFKERLTGKHTIKFNSSLFDKAEVVLNIKDITVMPEGYAALLALIYDEKGNVKNPEYDKKNLNVYCLDIGGGSIDSSAITVSNKKFVENAFFGIDVGLSEAQDRICDEVARKAGFSEFSRAELNTYLQDTDLNGIVNTNRGDFNINEIKTPHYDALADEILHKYRKKLKENDIDESRVTILNLVGGGSLQIGDNIIEKFKPIFKNVIKPVDAEECLYKNAEACYNASIGIEIE